LQVANAHQVEAKPGTRETDDKPEHTLARDNRRDDF
jgi:hypothetical protein